MSDEQCGTDPLQEHRWHYVDERDIFVCRRCGEMDEGYGEPEDAA